MFQRGRSDFSEYLLHHLVTLMLITISYSVNFLPIGAVIVIICDGTDIFVKLTKASIDVVPLFYTACLWFMLTVTWAIFRVYYFAWWILKPMHE